MAAPENLLLLLLTLFATSLLAHSRPPNILFILTDDQDVLLGGVTPLTSARTLLADRGTTFHRAFAVTPICCPSRSTILTGLYLHSHHVLNNTLSGGCSSPRWQQHHEPNTFPALLHSHGYRTFYAGKYLNQYGTKAAGGVAHVPKGWDWWLGLVGNSVYYNYTLSVNGTALRRGDRESDYLTDVLKDYSLEFLKDKRPQGDPFLMVVAPPAPHDPFTPAQRHKGAFAHRKAPRTPNFNLPVSNSKHWLLRLPPEVLPPETVDRIDEVFRNRWETLLSVDDLVRSLVARLQQLQLLDNTYVMLSSDHGFHLGQFGLPWDKRQPYETDIRIPLLLFGPGVPAAVSLSPVLTVDFAATILDMAGVQKTFGDGRSFLRPEDRLPGRSFPVEYHGEGGGGGRGSEKCSSDPEVKLCLPEASCKCMDARNNTYECVRRVWEDVDDLLCVFRDVESFVEYYDVGKDPYEMDNLAVGLDVEVWRVKRESGGVGEGRGKFGFLRGLKEVGREKEEK